MAYLPRARLLPGPCADRRSPPSSACRVSLAGALVDELGGPVAIGYRGAIAGLSGDSPGAMCVACAASGRAGRGGTRAALALFFSSRGALSFFGGFFCGAGELEIDRPIDLYVRSIGLSGACFSR